LQEGIYKLHNRRIIYRKISTKNKMDPSNGENGRFPKTSRKYVSVLLRIKGTLIGKDVTISIDPTEHNHYTSTECANQLLIPELNIIEKINSWNKKE
jgi:hypothetical protein